VSKNIILVKTIHSRTDAVLIFGIVKCERRCDANWQIALRHTNFHPEQFIALFCSQWFWFWLNLSIKTNMDVLSDAFHDILIMIQSHC